MDEKQQKQIERIQKFKPIDDTFFEVLANDIPFCQEMLRVILGDDGLVVKSVTVQKDAKNLIGRSVRLDALCTLSDETLASIEVQRADHDNHFKRVRYIASCITASETDTGKKFEKIPNVIMVYISEFDLLKGQKTAYHIEKVVKETGEVIDDGLKEIFVNTKVDDGTDLGEFLQLFNQTEVNNPKFPAFTNRMNYIKHSEGGHREMCAIMEEYATERVDEVKCGQVKAAIENGIDPQLIVKIIGVPLETVLKIKEEMQS